MELGEIRENLKNIYDITRKMWYGKENRARARELEAAMARLGRHKQMWISGAAAGVLLVAGGLFLWRSGFVEALGSAQALQAYMERFAPYSHGVFFLIQYLSVILAPIPSNVSALAGGVLFGTWVSFLLTFSAVLCGSVTVFLLARGLGQGFADRLISRRVSQRYLAVIRAKTDTFLFLAFLFPFFPDDVLCILAGLTTIPFHRFFVIALLTRPWGLLVASAVGGASLELPLWAMGLLGAAGLAVFLLGLRWGDRWEEAVMARLHRRERK